MSGVLMLLVTGGMAASASPTTATGEESGTPPTPLEVTTNTVTVSVQGGIAPYTYAWSKVVGADVTITAPTSATTAFTETREPGTILSGTYRCTVTDAAMLTARVDVIVTLNFVDIS